MSLKANTCYELQKTKSSDDKTHAYLAKHANLVLRDKKSHRHLMSVQVEIVPSAVERKDAIFGTFMQTVGPYQLLVNEGQGCCYKFHVTSALPDGCGLAFHMVRGDSFREVNAVSYLAGKATITVEADASSGSRQMCLEQVTKKVPDPAKPDATVTVPIKVAEAGVEACLSYTVSVLVMESTPPPVKAWFKDAEWTASPVLMVEDDVVAVVVAKASKDRSRGGPAGEDEEHGLRRDDPELQGLVTGPSEDDAEDEEGDSDMEEVHSHSSRPILQSGFVSLKSASVTLQSASAGPPPPFTSAAFSLGGGGFSFGSNSGFSFGGGGSNSDSSSSSSSSSSNGSGFSFGSTGNSSSLFSGGGGFGSGSSSDSAFGGGGFGSGGGNFSFGGGGFGSSFGSSSSASATSLFGSSGASNFSLGSAGGGGFGGFGGFGDRSTDNEAWDFGVSASQSAGPRSSEVMQNLAASGPRSALFGAPSSSSRDPPSYELESPADAIVSEAAAAASAPPPDDRKQLQEIAQSIVARAVFKDTITVSTRAVEHVEDLDTNCCVTFHISLTKYPERVHDLKWSAEALQEWVERYNAKLHKNEIAEAKLVKGKNLFVSDECVICCVDVPKAPVPWTILLACGHQAMCQDCFKKWKAKSSDCPICRGLVVRTLEPVIV